MTEGAGVVQKNFSGSSSQHWILTGFGDGVYKLINQLSGLSATVFKDSLSSIGQTAFTNLDNQKFVLFPGTDPDYFKLVAIQSGNVMDVNGAGTTDGAVLQQSNNLNQSSAEWKLVPATEMGINDPNGQEMLRVYPNPVAEYLFINPGNYTITRIQIMDLQGNMLKESIQHSDKVSVASLNPGMYLVNVFVEGNICPTVLKFIKSR